MLTIIASLIPALVALASVNPKWAVAAVVVQVLGALAGIAVNKKSGETILITGIRYQGEEGLDRQPLLLELSNRPQTSISAHSAIDIQIQEQEHSMTLVISLDTRSLGSRKYPPVLVAKACAEVSLIDIDPDYWLKLEPIIFTTDDDSGDNANLDSETMSHWAC